MIRFILTIAVIAAIFIAVLPSGCGSGGGGDQQDKSLEQQIVNSPPEQNTAALRVTAVHDLGAIENNSAIAMRDCGYSAIFEGRSVWIFGDTILTTANEHNRFLQCNSWSSTYDIDAGDQLSGWTEEVDAVGAPTEFFPLTAAEKQYNEMHRGDHCQEAPCNALWAIWPGTIVVDDSKGWAYVFYRKVHVEHGQLKFFHVGHSMAVWKNYNDPAQRPIFELVDDYPTLFFSEGENGYGSAAFIEQGLVYVYGCELDENGLTKPCRLARVPIADILERKSWQFYSGNDTWSSNVSSAANLFNGNDMMTVFYVPHIGHYVSIYSEPMAAKTMIRTAAKLQGPWSRPQELFTPIAPENELGWVYDAIAHPEFSQDNGRIIYVTYSRQIAPALSEMRLIEAVLEPAL